MTTIICKPLSAYMLDFLRAYLTFAAGTTSAGTARGEHNPSCFTPKFGLCSAVSDYTFYIAHPILSMDKFTRNMDQMLFRRMCAAAGGDFVGTDTVYPFGYEEYKKRVNDYTQYECPNRLGFIRMFIKELEIECAN